MIRETGFYWVVFEREVTIGHWDPRCIGVGWTIPGYYEEQPDDRVYVISSRIERPEQRSACAHPKAAETFGGDCGACGTYGVHK